MPSPIVQGLYDERTSSIRYVVACPATGRCAIVDPVLDDDETSGSFATAGRRCLVLPLDALPGFSCL